MIMEYIPLSSVEFDKLLISSDRAPPVCIDDYPS